MQKFLLLLSITCFYSFVSPFANSALVIPPGKEIFSKEGLYNSISSLRLKQLQQLSGRKLTLKEKIGFLILKHKLKHRETEGKGTSNTAFAMALIGLGLLVLGLFVPYIIIGSVVAAILAVALGSSAYKQDRSDKKAHTAKIIGWLTLGIIALLLIIAAIIIATWTSWV